MIKNLTGMTLDTVQQLIHDSGRKVVSIEAVSPPPRAGRPFRQDIPPITFVATAWEGDNGDIRLRTVSVPDVSALANFSKQDGT